MYSPLAPTGIGADTIGPVKPSVSALGITLPATGCPLRSTSRPEYGTGTGTVRSTPSTVIPAPACTVGATSPVKTSP